MLAKGVLKEITAKYPENYIY